MYKEVFASRLKEARKKTGFTQREVEEETGVPGVNISRYEKGIRETDIETLGRLANFYGVSTDWLIGLGMQPGIKQIQVETKKPNEDLEIDEIIGTIENTGNIGNIGGKGNSVYLNSVNKKKKPKTQ
ncbi:hypothetical protein FACS189490_10310 [Clostridia bacterium]|nr:hypothetical protein FACS189490_10310 [Clostridia bacterium]